ncbi:hypothetical protein DXK91_15405 [Parageobacillus toebii]|nr:hypothetical protein CN643_05285 [Parageobacillus yumthangensis]PUF88553.1 hypothetical protein DCC82_05555 [Geobacillus sp. LYN3]RDV21190.1 hypothetical protein DXK91_15405 [Parageobacillus toebii]
MFFACRGACRPEGEGYLTPSGCEPKLDREEKRRAKQFKKKKTPNAKRGKIQLFRKGGDSDVQIACSQY